MTSIRMLFLTVVAVFFPTFCVGSLVDSDYAKNDYSASVVPTLNYVINEEDKAPLLIDGFHREYNMKNDNPLDVDVRNVIIGFIRQPFYLEWRGSILYAIHPNPIDFDFNRAGVRYEFVAKIGEQKEIQIDHHDNGQKGYQRFWKSPDKPETTFFLYAAGGNSGDDSADNWTSVTLNVSRRLVEEDGWETWATSTVDVPNFHEMLQQKLRVDLNLPKLVIPKNDVQERGDVRYFRVRPNRIYMTRFYCNGDGGGSYEVVPTDGEILISDELRIDNLSLTVEYNKVNGKWEWTDQKKFVKADPSSAV
eukprot:954481_1